MKKEVIYQKSGRLRFIGHLDILRALIRSMRRANLPLAYSKGFHPHPLLSFASPLALGWEGQNELMEVTLEEDLPDDVFLEKLQTVLPEGLGVSKCRTRVEPAPSLISQVAAGKYRIQLPMIEGMEEGEYETAFSALMKKDCLMSQKTGKVRGRKTMIDFDMKPLVYAYAFSSQTQLELILALGQDQTLKPNLLMEALYKEMGREALINQEFIVRDLLLSMDDSEGQDRSFTPLIF